MRPEYSSINGKTASELITFYRLAKKYNEIAYKSKDKSDQESLLSDEMNQLSQNAEETDKTERENKLAMIQYFLSVNDTNLNKSRYVLAQINKNNGVSDKAEYLDIDNNLAKCKKANDELLKQKVSTFDWVGVIGSIPIRPIRFTSKKPLFYKVFFFCVQLFF